MLPKTVILIIMAIAISKEEEMKIKKLLKINNKMIEVPITIPFGGCCIWHL